MRNWRTKYLHHHKPPSDAQVTKWLVSKKRPDRLKAYELLAAQGKYDILLPAALVETDMGLLSKIQPFLYPEPPIEFLKHAHSQQRGPDASLFLRYEIAEGNYLYAEEVLVQPLRKRSRLNVETIEALGLAYFRSGAGLLRRYLGSPILSLARARTVMPASFYEGSSRPVGHDENELIAATSEKAIAAAVALVRLDHQVPVEVPLSIKNELVQNLPNCLARDRAIAAMDFVLYANKYTNDWREVVGTHPPFVWMIEDVALALVKRGDFGTLGGMLQKTLAEHKTFGSDSLPGELTRSKFIYWPLTDWLVTNGWSSIAPHIRHRDHGISPPPYWTWLDQRSPALSGLDKCVCRDCTQRRLKSGSPTSHNSM